MANVGDGALDLYKALDEVFSRTRHHDARCKNRERPGQVPLSVQPTMKKDLREVYWARAQRPPKRRPTSSPRSFAPSTAGRSNAWSRIATHYRSSGIFLPNIGADLSTTNPIERVSATERYRPLRMKGSLSPTTAKPMVFKLVIAASTTWRRLKSTNPLPKVVAIVGFNDGIEIIQVPANQVPDHLVT
ncbi:transposase-like protein [Bradyrhizobium sp. i1.4.4]